MLKNIFYTSLVIAVLDIIIYFYFSSNSYTWSHPILAGLVQILLTEAIMVILVIWWIIYFLITTDFSNIWLPILVILFIAGYFTKVQIQINSSKKQEQKAKSEWLYKIENKHYSSDKLGISFDYISESQFDGTATIEENKDTLRLNLSKKPQGNDALKVFKKDSNSTLIDFLKNTYKTENPICRFFPYVAEGFSATNLGFSSDYSVAIMYGDPATGEGCPKFGMEIPDDHQNYFVMNKKQPSKYIFLLLSDYAIEAYRPKDPQDFPPKWYETIKIQ